MATAAEITQTFEAALFTAEPAQIERLAEQLIVAGGDLDGLIDALNAEDTQPDLLVARRYKSALRRVADPAYFARCLRTDAGDLDARSDRMIAEAAEDLGRAQARRQRGEHDLAESFQTSGMAAQRLAEDLATLATDKRLAAARIERRASRQNDLAGLVIDIILQTGKAA